jgi:hypothetical protein
MAYNAHQLRAIYDRTDGYCHICHRKLSLKNYAAIGKRGAWEVEHSRPRARGGTDHGNNLYAACIACNRDKSDFSTRTARGWRGTTRAPLSKEKKKKITRENAVACGLIGGVIGWAGGPVGAAIGATIGATVGKSIKPPKV